MLKSISLMLKTEKDTNKKQPLLAVYVVRVERIELSSQVWKTCILTTVLYPLDGAGDWNRTSDLLDHNQTL